MLSGQTMVAVAEAVERCERDLKMGQERLIAFQRTNNLPLLQAQSGVAANCLTKLSLQLSELQLEELPLQRPALSPAETAARPALRLKVEHVRNSIKEWEAKIVEANRLIADADLLQQTVQRAQGLCNRLAAIFDNLDLERRLAQETLVILESASPAKSVAFRQRRLVGVAGAGGLSVGLGALVLLALLPTRRSHTPQANP